LPPGIENLDSPTFKLLEAFASAGGRVLQFSQIKTIDGKPDARTDGFERLILQDRADTSKNEKVLRDLGAKDFSISFSPTYRGDLYHHRRKLSDGDLLFLANSSLEQHAQGSVRMSGEDVLTLDLFTGGVYRYPAETTDHQVTFDFVLPPGGSQLFFVAKQKQGEFANYTRPGEAGVEIPSPTEVKPVEENTLAIDFCDIAFGKTDLKNLNVYDATDTLFKHNGFKNGNPWNTSVQFKNNTMARDTFSAGTGFTATYHFTILDKVDRAALKAVVERAGLYKIKVNDKPVEPLPGRWWLDKAFNVVDIGKLLQAGPNKLSLTADKMSIHAELEPIYILGNFSLTSAAHGWNITSPAGLRLGSWKAQGLPMYARNVSYLKKINLEKKDGKSYWVELGHWQGTVCSVVVNGQSAGIIAYPPYQLDVTSSLKQGANTIDVAVVGSLKNLLGPHFNKPKPGLVSPWHFRYVKTYPPGKEYDLYDYGLMEDYRLIER
jgi:hypothetical protein